MTLFEHHQVIQTLAERQPFRLTGRVSRVTGLLVEGTVPGAHLGMMCKLRRPGTKMSEAISAEIVAIRGNMASLMPLAGVQGIHSGTEIYGTPQQPLVTVGDGLLGRVLDGWGNPSDSLRSLGRTDSASKSDQPLSPGVESKMRGFFGSAVIEAPPPPCSRIKSPRATQTRVRRVLWAKTMRDTRSDARPSSRRKLPRSRQTLSIIHI